MNDPLPPDLLGRWVRLRWCATFGWTFDEYDRQEVSELAEAEMMISKAVKMRRPVALW